MVIVIRSDLKMSKGKMAAQVAHAAVSCAMKSNKYSSALFKGWMNQGQKKVVLKVPDKKALLDLYEEAQVKGLTSKIIADAGHTELEPGTITCLGIGPSKEKDIDRLTSDLKLV